MFYILSLLFYINFNKAIIVGYKNKQYFMIYKNIIFL